jgi:hypothetical protein
MKITEYLNKLLAEWGEANKRYETLDRECLELKRQYEEKLREAKDAWNIMDTLLEKIEEAEHFLNGGK